MRNFFLVLFFVFFTCTISTAQDYEKTRDYRNLNHSLTADYNQPTNLYPLNKTNSGNGVWTELNPNLPRVDYLGAHFINPDTGWAVGVGGTIIKTMDGGSSWTISDTPTSNILLKVSSFNADTVIAAGYSGTILRSTNGGKNFIEISSGVTGALWGLQMINDTLGWACGTGNSIVKTSNAGLTWQIVTTGINTNYWWLDFIDELTGFVACDDGIILKTTDGGTNWQQYQGGNNWALYTIDAIDSLHIVAGGANGKNVYSSDGGISWVENYRLIFDDVNCISFIDADTGYAIGVDWGIRKTTDRGQSWFASNVNVGEWHLQLLKNYTAYCVGNSLKLNKSTGTYDNWERLIINDGFGNIFFVDDVEGWVLGKVIYHTTNGGIDWTVNENYPYNGMFGILQKVYFFNSDTGLVTSSPNHFLIYKTTNRGETWERKYVTGLIDSMGAIRKFFFINNQTGWAVTNRGAIIKTNNGGDSWFAQYNGLSFITFKSIHFYDSLNGWTANGNRSPFKTTNGGEEWIEQTNLPFRESRDVYFANPDSGWIINGNYLYRTIDGGVSWTEVFQSPTRLWGFHYFENRKHWLINGDGHLYETNDGGETWNDIISDVPTGFADFHSPSNKYGYACGGGGLILKYVDDSITGMNADDETTLTDFKIYQNYPNPFNPITRISYSIKEAGLVSLSIYDILGNEVSVLVNETKAPGNHSVTFNASNLPSGIYFYKLTSGRFSETKKLILLK